MLIAGEPTVSLSVTPNDNVVVSGDVVKLCRNTTTTVEFLCVAHELSVLQWIRNSNYEIYRFHIRILPPFEDEKGSYTVYLDNDTSVDEVSKKFNNITTRLKTDVNSNRNISDKIECLAHVTEQEPAIDSVTFRFIGKFTQYSIVHTHYKLLLNTLLQMLL